MQPIESFTYRLDRNTLSSRSRLHLRRRVRKAATAALIMAAVFVFYLCSPAPAAFSAFFGALMLAAIISCLALRSKIKTTDHILDYRDEDSFVRLEFYEKYLCQYRSKNGEQQSMTRMDYAHILHARLDSGFLLLESHRENLFIPLSLLSKDAFILRRTNKLPKPGADGDPVFYDQRLKNLSVVLAVLSVLSPALGYIFSSPAAGTAVFYLLLPLPALSIIFALLMHRRGLRFVRNLIIGVVFALLLICCGLWSGSADAPDYIGEDHLQRCESLLDMEFPAHSSAETKVVPYMDYEDPIFMTTLLLPRSSVEETERLVASGQPWLSPMPTVLDAISAPFGGRSQYDAAFIYNIDTHQFNTLPGQSGTYRFIGVYYLSDYRQIYLVEYSLDFIA